jgi:hypothetical protein
VAHREITHPGRGWSIARRVVLAGALSIVLVGLAANPSLAVFSRAATIGTNTLATATLDPPGGLNVTQTCAEDGTPGSNASWSTTPSAYATGYQLQRYNGALLEDEITTTPRAATTATDGPLTSGTTYDYKLFSDYNNWTSAVITDSSTITAGAPSHKATGPGGTAGSSEPDLTLSTPAGVAADDVMIAHVVWHEHAPAGSVTAPGWTEIRLDNSGDHVRQSVFYKVATGSEPSTYTFTDTLDDWGSAAGVIAAYTGVDVTDPIVTHSGQTGSGSSMIAPSVSIPESNTLLLALFVQFSEGDISPPTGMTERWELLAGEGGTAATAEGSEENRPSSGATGTRTATSTDGGDYVGALVVLRPV